MKTSTIYRAYKILKEIPVWTIYFIKEYLAMILIVLILIFLININRIL